MDKTTAIETLGLNDLFSPIELIRTYSESVKNTVDLIEFTHDQNTINELVSRLNEFSEAYLVLGESINSNNYELQPLIIFTDASVRKDLKTAAFAIVVKNIPFNFDIPLPIIKKYNLNIEAESSVEMCILSGEILNYNVDAAEIMAIMAAVDIFSYLARVSKQKMVIYTDSLNAKKILGDKRMPPRTKLYATLRKYFLRICAMNHLEVIIKKVKAHSGIELNELVDQVARQRLNNKFKN